MSEYKITSANIKEWAKNYKGPLFDGILCDPPYELGFMGKSWDSSGIAFDVDMWKDLLRILKPGGHLLAFSGSRTYHRMAVAIEDAGFEIRDMIEYVYGSGFPKSLNIGKSVEAFVTTGNASKNGFHKLDGERRDGRIGMYDTVEEQGFRVKNPDQLGAYDLDPTTDEAKQWNGYGTALKPAHEPICMARKPLSEKTVAENCLKWGTGGINIDESRVPLAGEWDKGTMGTFRKAYDDKNKTYDGTKGNISFGGKELRADRDVVEKYGRFPANLIHDGSDEVEAVFPQTGKSRPDHRNEPSSTGDSGIYGKGYKRQPNMLNDSGSASRFFYCAKSSKSERNAGLEGFEDIKLDIGDDRPSGSFNERFGHNEPRPTKNAHPTVKPLSLTKYLATLIKPPTGGRLLVPFSGSGSEMIGALQAGWGYVEGVELTEEYIPIAEARIKYWLSRVEEEDKQEVLL